MFALTGEANFNLLQAVEHLATALQIKTVSYPDYDKVNYQAYQEFLHFLQESYPSVHRECRREMINDYCPAFIWSGKDSGDHKPLLLIGHYDVVPAGEDSAWLQPPFSGTVQDNYIWGRGALDNKNQVIAVMEVIEYLIKSGCQPHRDIYIVFGFDEEVGGTRGAEQAAALFKERGLQFECIIDEGGCIVTDMLEGLTVPSALVGIAEKASANIQLTVSGQGGHSSMPPPNTAVGVMAEIVSNVEDHPMPPRLIMPVKELFKRMAPHMGPKRLALQNIATLFPLIQSTLSKNAATNSLIRTTIAFTMVEGGDAPNVLPQKVRAIANLRILQGDSMDSVIAHIRKVNPGLQFEIDKLLIEEPSGISPIDGVVYRRIEQVIHSMYPEVLVMPYLMSGGTDSRKYAGLCSHIYRFSAMVLTKEDYASIHSNNERISIDNFAGMMDFYYRFLADYVVRG